MPKGDVLSLALIIRLIPLKRGRHVKYIVNMVVLNAYIECEGKACCCRSISVLCDVCDAARTALRNVCVTSFGASPLQIVDERDGTILL